MALVLAARRGCLPLPGDYRAAGAYKQEGTPPPTLWGSRRLAAKHRWQRTGRHPSHTQLSSPSLLGARGWTTSSSQSRTWTGDRGQGGHLLLLGTLVGLAVTPATNLAGLIW